MPRVKKCAHCKTAIPEPKPFQKACSPKCAIELVRHKEKKERRKETRQMREAAKTKPKLISETQTVFNKYIRIRDYGLPCPSCGRYDHEIEDIYTGGKWDCGHYLAVGSHPELRFDESNAHRQCKVCNGGAGKYTRKNHTVQQSYREGLVQRIGLQEVERLEGPHDVPNWTHDEIRAIKQTYKDKTKALRHD